MKSKRNYKKIAACLIAAMLTMSTASIFPSKSVSAADVCVVDTNVEHQSIRGFGGINHPEWAGDLTQSQRQTAFGNGANELGLTVLRVFVNPDNSQWSKALPTAQFATKMGVTVFASPWEPPANLAEQYPDSKVGKLHLPKSNYAAYAKHLNDFGTYMKNNQVDLYSISVQNEPDYASEWTHWTTDETTDFIANYGDQITSTRLMSPESFQYSPDGASWIDHGTGDGGKRFYTKILNNAKAMANCDVFGTHFYGTQRAWMDFPELENCGKEIWMTEVYVPNSDQDSANRYPEALQVSENIHNAMVVGNMSAYTWWYIRRSYGLMTEDGKISKRGYCMAQYSKYVRPGDVRIDATEQPSENVYISAYKGDDNQVTIVAINKGTEGYSQQFAVNAGEQIADVDRYRTSASENLAETENMEHNTSTFWAQLPAESVSTFVVTLEDKPVEPDENGYYFHDTFEDSNCDWQGHGSADVTLSGRIPYQGTNALLVQNRESAWNGAEKSLNAKAFQAGKEYSFSVCLNYMDGDDTKNAALSLQYTNTAGETKYARIASASAVKGNYVQLANPSFQLPKDGTNFKIYVETEGDTDNFYIDEAIGAVKDTVIAPPPAVTTTTTTIITTTTTPATILTTAATTLAPTTITTIETSVIGDVNHDGKFDILDLIMMQKWLLAVPDATLTDWKAGDLQKDDIINILDFCKMKYVLIQNN